MKKYLFAFLIFNLSFIIHNSLLAQTLTQQVNASGGGYYQQINGSMQFTIGEPITETYYGSGARMYNGFEQGSYVILGVDETPANTGITTDIFPNPNNGIFNILISTETNSLFEIKIMNAQGKLLLNKELNANEAGHIDITVFAGSVYFVMITNSEKKYLKTFKIIKQ